MFVYQKWTIVLIVASNGSIQFTFHIAQLCSVPKSSDNLLFFTGSQIEFNYGLSCRHGIWRNLTQLSTAVNLPLLLVHVQWAFVGARLHCFTSGRCITSS